MKRILPAFLMFAAAGCGITDANNVALRVEGTVTAQATGLPVGGARIALFEDAILVGGNYTEFATTTTDSQGRYTLNKSLGKDCTRPFFVLGVRASATGFIGQSKSAECNETVQRLDFVLQTSP